MKNHTFKYNVLALAMAAAVGVALPAYAQQVQSEDEQAEQAEQVNAQETITVTSRKRTESIVEVPMNVTSISAIEVADRNITSKDELYRTLAGAASPTGALILRGLSGGNGSAPGTTSSFTDDIPFNFGDLFDIQAVEVLRGPQGTLWGSNAIGGTVRVITQKPRIDEVEVLTSVQARNTKNVSGTGLSAWGAVNIPLLPNQMAMRVTGHASNTPGPITNTNTGVQAEDESSYVRTQILWELNEDTTFNFAWYNVHDKTVGSSFADLSQPNAQLSTTVTPDDSYPWGYDVGIVSTPCEAGQNRAECFGDVSAGVPRKYQQWESMDDWTESETNLISLTAAFENVGGFADITYAGSYRKNTFESLDNWSRLDMADLTRTWIINYDETQRVTHEFRVQDVGQTENLSWTLGAFYDRGWRGYIPNAQYQYHDATEAGIAIFSYMTDWSGWGVPQDQWGWGEDIKSIADMGNYLYGDPSINYNMIYNGTKNAEFALFGEASYMIETEDMGRFEITAGIRYFDLEDFADYSYSGVWYGPAGGASAVGGEESGNRKKFSVAWLPEGGNQSVYALYSEGYRPGGNNGPLANACNDEFSANFVERYDSDAIDNYELGYKANMGALSFASAVYQIDWTDVWATVYMPSCGFSYTANAAKARSRGVEWESKLRLDNDMNVFFNASYTKSEMLSDSPGVQAEAGDDMTQVPKYNAYLGLDKGFDFYGYYTSVRLDVEAYGEYKSHFNARDDGYDTVDPYQRVNLSTRIELSESAKLSFYINNLFDSEIEEYKQARSRTSSTQNLYVLYAPERNFTIRLDWNFM